MTQSIRKASCIPASTIEKTEMAEALYHEAMSGFDKKIVVLDDDPTGVQTVHGIDVFTRWDQASLDEGFSQDSSMFFVLTNSRAMSEGETAKVHAEIAKRILESSRKIGKDFVLISRSDSTLRGHYPIETDTLRKTIEENSSLRFDGEILCPFFLEGGRLTMDGIHYVREKDVLVPASQTEFARDSTFGYSHSRLSEWIEEKTKHAYSAQSVIAITLDMLAEGNSDLVCDILCEVSNYGKVTLDAVSYEDIKVFAAGYVKAVRKGKRFLFRSAAAIPKILGGITDKALLGREDLGTGVTHGGLIIAGSHVKKTTRQLEVLFARLPQIAGFEFLVAKAGKEGGLEEETTRLVGQITKTIEKGITACVYTSRDYLDIPGSREDKLRTSVRISDAVTNIVKRLPIRPAFVVAKGGITSSDIGVKGLSVRKARVLGQIAPGVPVWQTDKNSKYGEIPYVIFPGNVGQEDTLAEVVAKLIG